MTQTNSQIEDRRLLRKFLGLLASVTHEEDKRHPITGHLLARGAKHYAQQIKVLRWKINEG